MLYVTGRTPVSVANYHVICPRQDTSSVTNDHVTCLRKDTSILHLEDIVMLAAMGPPGGGRNHVTHRFLRHFNIIGIESFDEETMKGIFLPIMDWHFGKGFEVAFRRYPKVSFFLLLQLEIVQ